MKYELDEIEQAALFNHWVCEWCGKVPSECAAAQDGHSITLTDKYERG